MGNRSEHNNSKPQFAAATVRATARFLTALVASPVARAALLLVGILVQLVLLFLVGEMIDLSITLMEIWAELARKHLEITL